MHLFAVASVNIAISHILMNARYNVLQFIADDMGLAAISLT